MFSCFWMDLDLFDTWTILIVDGNGYWCKSISLYSGDLRCRRKVRRSSGSKVEKSPGKAKANFVLTSSRFGIDQVLGEGLPMLKALVQTLAELPMMNRCHNSYPRKNCSRSGTLTRRL